MLLPLTKDKLEQLAQFGIPKVTQGWIVNDVFDFDNVAFSKPTSSNTDRQTALRYLCCAECERGPIGYASLENPNGKIIVLDQSKVA